MDCSKCPTLLAESKKVSDQNKQIEILEGRLKLCRLAMRQHDMGHLYPGSSKEYEDNIKASMEAGGKELTQELYASNKFNQLKNSQQIGALRDNIKNLLEFIESKEITAIELNEFLQSKALRNDIVDVHALLIETTS